MTGKIEEKSENMMDNNRKSKTLAEELLIKVKYLSSTRRKRLGRSALQRINKGLERTTKEAGIKIELADDEENTC